MSFFYMIKVYNTYIFCKWFCTTFCAFKPLPLSFYSRTRSFLCSHSKKPLTVLLSDDSQTGLSLQTYQGTLHSGYQKKKHLSMHSNAN